MNNEQKITIKNRPLSPFGAVGLKKMFMKKITFLFLMWLFAASCATVKTTADHSAKTSPPALPNLSRPSGTLSTGEGLRNGTFSEGAAQPATSGCSTPPVYYTGNDEPAAYGLFIVRDEPVSVSSQQLQSAAPSPVERAGGEVVSAEGEVSSAGCNTPPVYYTGNDEPAAYGLFIVRDEPVSVSSQQLQSAAPSKNVPFLSPSPVERVPEGRERLERAGGEVVSAGEEVSSAGCTTPPVYYTGNDEPAAYGLFLVTDEPNE
jgi:hypothetical protein